MGNPRLITTTSRSLTLQLKPITKKSLKTQIFSWKSSRGFTDHSVPSLSGEGYSARLSHNHSGSPNLSSVRINVRVANHPCAIVYGSESQGPRIPTIGGRALDLYRLFLEVTARGGIEKVIRDRKWKEVISAFRFPSTITSASFVLRKYYLSLLFHFEQVYYFRKEVPSIPLDDPASRIPINGSVARHVFEDGATTNQMASHVDFVLEPGNSVAGIIDAKFDGGYLITVNLGSEKLKGVIYHTPMSLHASQNSNTSAAPSHRDGKRHQLAPRDPSQPQSNSSGYNVFFAEHYTRHGQEKAISKKIGVLWSRLTDAEKQVYQDKERQGERQE